MKEWSRLKKTVVISAITFFGLGAVGALTSPQQKNSIVDTASSNSTTKITSPNVQKGTTISTDASDQTTQVSSSEPDASQPDTSAQSKTNSQTSDCDPNYSGGCVPIASDVDCGGGSGNGPAYFYGTANVVGTDIYGLDRDGDGFACE